MLTKSFGPLEGEVVALDSDSINGLRITGPNLRIFYVKYRKKAKIGLTTAVGDGLKPGANGMPSVW